MQLWQNLRARWQALSDRYSDLLAAYGRVAVATYFAIFFAVLGGFWLAITQGVEVSAAAGTPGTLAAAYVATKLTQPLRIGATLVLTPPIAHGLKWLRGTPESSTPAAPSDR